MTTVTSQYAVRHDEVSRHIEVLVHGLGPHGDLQPLDGRKEKELLPKYFFRLVFTLRSRWHVHRNCGYGHRSLATLHLRYPQSASHFHHR